MDSEGNFTIFRAVDFRQLALPIHFSNCTPARSTGKTTRTVLHTCLGNGWFDLLATRNFGCNSALLPSR